MEELREEMGDTMRFVFRHFPLTEIHPLAEHAAQAAEAAGAQGKFWEMHEILFERQPDFETPDLLEYADELELDIPRFTRELASAQYLERIRADVMSGVRGGVNGTPTFFINGKRHDESWDPHQPKAGGGALSEPAGTRSEARPLREGRTVNGRTVNGNCRHPKKPWCFETVRLCPVHRSPFTVLRFYQLFTVPAVLPMLTAGVEDQ